MSSIHNVCKLRNGDSKPMAEIFHTLLKHRVQVRPLILFPYDAGKGRTFSNLPTFQVLHKCAYKQYDLVIKHF